jgi:hypothetical protein
MMKHPLILLTLVISISLFFTSCETARPFYDNDEKQWSENTLPPASRLEFTVFLMGDAGEADLNPLEPNFRFLQSQLQEADENSAIVFLGDNIYPAGLVPEDHPERKQAEALLNAQLDLLKDFKGAPYFIPGNHDWNRMSAGGREAVQRQAKYIEDYLDNKKVYYPKDGCGDPKDIQLSDHLTLILLDSQWWLHDWEAEPEMNKGCDIKSRADFERELSEMIDENDDDNILIALHHPIYTQGSHNGHFPLKEHIFPLTYLSDGLLIPLPGLGSLHPLVRYLGISRQDKTNPVYNDLIEAIKRSIKDQDDIVFASGHEHALEYFYEDDHHFVVSGAGSKHSYLKKGYDLQFGYEKEGFSKLYYYQDGSVWLEFWAAPRGSDQGTLIFRKMLKDKDLQAPVDPEDSFETIWEDLADSVGYIAAPNYEASKSKRFWLGRNYRDAWTAGLQLPVLNMDEKLGGLRPIKKGGGLQSKSLRLEAADGKQYVLRSIYKDASLILPEFARNTVIDTIFQDQMSMDHPYGALIIGPLADAVGVYHANPQYYYLPAQPRLGDFNDIFAHEAYLFEERPAGNREDVASFGRPEDIDSYRKMLKNIRDEHDHLIDQDQTLYSRLFDIYIGDWDRHDDQWRWAVFEKDDKKFYSPIPRDRDHAFLSFRGILPYIASRKWAARQLHSFNHDIHDIRGLSFNARHFDRAYLNEQDLSDWLRIANDMKTRLTDKVIEEAVRQWPDTLYTLNGKEIIAKLKSRRDKLPEFAQELYEFVAKEVDVRGTDKRERFEVTRLPGGKTQVIVLAVNKEREIKDTLYQRLFDQTYTKEIRLFGLKGDDAFFISGESGPNSLLRIIGGPDEDVIRDESKVAGGKRTRVYDLAKEDNEIDLGQEAKDKTSDDPKENEYDRLAFKYPKTMPLIIPGNNPDDGFSLGLGFIRTLHGFRKSPYKTKHQLQLSYAFATEAAKILYVGDFIERIGSLDLLMNLEAFAPTFVNNYFGLGNNTVYTDQDDLNFNRLRYGRIRINPALKKRFALNTQQVVLGLHYTLTDPTRNVGRISDPSFDNLSGLSDEDYQPHHYAGLRFSYHIDKVDTKFYPKSGLRFNVGGSWNMDVEDTGRNYLDFNTDLSFYYTPFSPFPLTLAFRGGYAANFGEYEFFQANYLGRRTNLRGYRAERFGGDKAMYLNSEVRLQLFKIRGFVLPMNVGVIGFYDTGRVWHEADPEGEDFNQWHPGWGGGIFLSPYDLIAFSGMYTKSDEWDFIEVKLGFFF